MFKKENIPWNKGLTKETDERVRQYSYTQSENKKNTGAAKGKNNPMFGVHRFGKDSPHYGRKHNLDTKINLSKFRKEYYTNHKHPSIGKKRIDLTLRNLKSAGKNYTEIYGLSKSIEIKNKIAEAQTGNKSHFWRGGIAYTPYTSEFNKRLKKIIKERDSYTCQICGIKTIRTGDIHHIDYDKKNSDQSNLILLCNSCHSKTNFDRRNWMDVLSMFISIKLKKKDKWEYLNIPPSEVGYG